MSLRNLPRAARGGILTAEAFNELATAAERANRHTAELPLRVFEDVAGFHHMIDPEKLLEMIPSTGSITVEEADGSPSYTNITTLQVDQASGLNLSQPVAGTAQIHLAEIIPGNKTFEGDITFEGDVTFGGSFVLTSQRKSIATGSISADQIALAPLNGFWWQVNVTGNYTLHGIDASAATSGDWYEFTNVGSGILTIPHQSGSATTGNRIYTCSGQTERLHTGEAGYFQYDATAFGGDGGWRFYRLCCRSGKTSAEITISSDQAALSLLKPFWWLANVSGAYTLHGIDAANAATGEWRELTNVGTGVLSVTNAGAATTGNKILTCSGRTERLRPNEAGYFQYDEAAFGGDGGWRLYRLCCPKGKSVAEATVGADYPAFTILNGFWWILNVTGAHQLQGIASTGALEGDWYEITNAGTGILSVMDNSGSAATGNRIFTSTGLDVDLEANQSGIIQRRDDLDGGSGGWLFTPYFTDELAQDAVGDILDDTDTVTLTYDDLGDSIMADVRYQMSITKDVNGLKLVNDEASPGNDEYYGTNSGGTKGFYPLPAAGASDAHWVKITKSYTAFSAAASTIDIEIYSLPAKTQVQWAVIKHTQAFTGGTLSSYSFSVGVVGTSYNDYIATLFNCFGAPSDTLFGQATTTTMPKLHNFGAATSVRAKAQSNGAFLNAATQGSVDFYLLIGTLP